MAAAEQLLKYPVKLRTDQGEPFCELAPHASVQLLDDLVKGLLGSDQVLVLGLHKFIPFRKLPVILNGVDVDISQGTDPVFPLSDLIFHLWYGNQAVVSQLLGSGPCQLILAPHIFHGGVPFFFLLFFLSLQAEQLLVQPGKPVRKGFPPGKEILLSSAQGFLFLSGPFGFLHERSGLLLDRTDLLLYGFDLQEPLLYGLFAVSGAGVQGLLFSQEPSGLLLKTAEVLVQERILLLQTSGLQLDLGKGPGGLFPLVSRRLKKHSIGCDRLVSGGIFCLQLLHGCQESGDIPSDLTHLLLQLAVFQVHVCGGFCQLLLLLVQLPQGQLCRILLQIPGLERGPDTGKAAVLFLQEGFLEDQLLLDPVHCQESFFTGLLHFLHLSSPSQEIAGIFKGAAAHGAAGT